MEKKGVFQWIVDLAVLVLLMMILIGQRDAARDRRDTELELLAMRKSIEQMALDAAESAGRQSGFRTEARTEHARLQGEINSLRHYQRYPPNEPATEIP